jgi:hypothetical protein
MRRNSRANRAGIPIQPDRGTAIALRGIEQAPGTRHPASGSADTAAQEMN